MRRPTLPAAGRAQRGRGRGRARPAGLRARGTRWAAGRSQCRRAVPTALCCGRTSHNILKFFGHCNDFDREMRKCLKKEYEEKRNRSRERGIAMRKRLSSLPEESEK
ncbi:COX assembly mitochondrial protein 2 homolog isoform X1 [Dipodomys merriami]|uniref:COX assembly mitochondrial protein 2 homolog isoform X1 n=1 Tax=Dipodomys merriami TaxID=94247 RepID=UPI00384BEB25